MTISYAIGRNSTEGRTHTMCIEGTHGTMVGMGARACLQAEPCVDGKSQTGVVGVDSSLGLAQLTTVFAFASRLRKP